MLTYDLHNDSVFSEDGKCYGVLTNGQQLTVVRNRDELENGIYTRKMSDVLRHLTPFVRAPFRARVFEDFNYVKLQHDEESTSRSIYTLESLTEQEILTNLLHVVYIDEPELQEHTLLDSKKLGIENNPNTYTGDYVLNNERTYRIEKQLDNIRINELFRENGFCYVGKVDFALYKKSLELDRLGRDLVRHPMRLLSEPDASSRLVNYHVLKREVTAEFLSKF